MESLAGEGKPWRRWFRRWQASDRRKAARLQVWGLVAYYWDGGEAVAHDVREISMGGLFLSTERHWYPGTLVTMTLQRIYVEEASSERTISVQARVIRQGSDGVGLAFITPELRSQRTGQPRETKVADRKSLDAFLHSFLASLEE